MANKKDKLMIAVDYYNTENTDPKDDDATTTYEIFESLEDAWKFAKENEKYFIRMWVADFNLDYIYKEEGSWNYEDTAYTYWESYTLFEKTNK